MRLLDMFSTVVFHSCVCCVKRDTEHSCEHRRIRTDTIYMSKQCICKASIFVCISRLLDVYFVYMCEWFDRSIYIWFEVFSFSLVYQLNGYIHLNRVYYYAYLSDCDRLLNHRNEIFLFIYCGVTGVLSSLKHIRFCN